MTKVYVKRNGDLITNVSIEGHSGYDQSGKDIICSAISGAVEVTIRLLERENENFSYDIVEKNATIDLKIKQPNAFTNDCLNSLVGFLNDLSIEYEKFLKIY